MAYGENIYARIISGDLNQEEIQQLKASGEWDEIQKILNVSQDLDLPNYDKQEGFDDLMRRRVPAVKLTKDKRHFRSLIIGIAASFILVLAGIFLFDSHLTEVSALVAENKSVELPDGTTVVLNDGSKIEYDKEGWSEKRYVKLTGEAQFNVVSGEAFKVVTQNGTVEVLGTRFNVRSWSKNWGVECYEGSVKVKTNQNETTLTAKQGVNIGNGKMLAVDNLTHESALWTQGTIRFYNTSLNEVFDELERQFEIELTMPHNDEKFSGYFTDKNLEEALGQICAPMKLKYTITDQNKVVISF